MRKSTIIKETVISIIIESTIHGLPNIFRAKEVFIKIIWLLFTIVSFLACTFYSYQSISAYLNFDFVTNINVIYDQNLQFPTVSFCSSSRKIQKETFKSYLHDYRNGRNCIRNIQCYAIK